MNAITELSCEKEYCVGSLLKISGTGYVVWL